jgi:hypothetical protein
MTQERWLLTGGAGYIGTHIANEFIRAGKSVVIYDSLYQGLESRIVYLRAKHNVEIPFIKVQLRTFSDLQSIQAVDIGIEKQAITKDGRLSMYDTDAEIIATPHSGDTVEAITLEHGPEPLTGRRAREEEDGPSPNKNRKRAVTMNKGAKKASGKAKKNAE